MKSEVERRTKSLRQKSDRPVGGQKGHEGTTRKMVANPDEIENVQSLLREAIHVRNEKPSATISAQIWLERLYELLKKNIDQLRKEFNELKRGLIKCRDYIFNFLETPAIPSDNNASERGIRKLKVKQKYPAASALIQAPMHSTQSTP